MTPIAQALSAALLHFIWQATMIACLLSMALLLLRNRTANARYLASCLALALMAALPAITTWTLYQNPQPLAITLTAWAAIPTASAGHASQSAGQSLALAWIAIWRQWALSVWSIGVFLFALRLLLSCRHVAALRRLSHAAEQPITEMVSRLAGRMKVDRAVRALISNMAESPSVVGWLRPAILLPAATLAGLEPEQLQAVLAHEIAHIRRQDYLVNLAQTFVETLLFYHPAVWWASARIRHERELCCDDAAVAVCGNAIAYARALTSLERLRATPRLVLGSTGGSLMYRIRRLAGVKQEMGRSRLPGIAALALGIACFAVTVHWAKAQQMAPEPPIDRELGINVSTTGELLHRSRVPYPESIYKNGSKGTVLLEATLDQSGNVADAHVLSGPPELRKAALQSVLQWQFKNGWAGETQQVSITFQDAQAVMQQDSQIMANQAQLTETFLEDELRAAKEQGDSEAVRKIEYKVAMARDAKLIVEQAAEIKQGDPNETQLRQLKLQLAEARLSLNEENPKIAALTAQIDDLNRQIAGFKEANQGRLPIGAETNETNRFLESQYLELEQKLAAASQSLSAQEPEVAALKAQIEALRKKMDAASLVGARLERLDFRGVPDDEEAGELRARINIGPGDLLTQESMDSVLATIRALDARLECGFRRDENGDAVLQIRGPGKAAVRK